MSKYHIEICDSRKLKGQYFVRMVGGTKKISNSETLESFAAVNKNILAHAKVFGALVAEIKSVLLSTNAIDKTSDKKWAKKFGIKTK
jgi:hypothetical protein